MSNLVPNKIFTLAYSRSCYFLLSLPLSSGKLTCTFDNLGLLFKNPLNKTHLHPSEEHSRLLGWVHHHRWVVTVEGSMIDLVKSERCS